MFFARMSRRGPLCVLFTNAKLCRLTLLRRPLLSYIRTGSRVAAATLGPWSGAEGCSNCEQGEPLSGHLPGFDRGRRGLAPPADFAPWPLPLGALLGSVRSRAGVVSDWLGSRWRGVFHVRPHPGPGNARVDRRGSFCGRRGPGAVCVGVAAGQRLNTGVQVVPPSVTVGAPRALTAAATRLKRSAASRLAALPGYISNHVPRPEPAFRRILEDVRELGFAA